MDKKDLKPASVFHYFEEICQSGKNRAGKNIPVHRTKILVFHPTSEQSPLPWTASWV